VAEPLIECVPNFSEGRDVGVIDAIAAAVTSVAGVSFLHRTSDADHNRSVLTFAGAPDAVAEAALRAVEQAARLIDLRHHQGKHPRIGAADVVPLVPIDGISLKECAALAHALGRAIWETVHVPVYYYEAAALRPQCRRLEDVRRGQFEGLSKAVETDEARRPDVGGPALHPSAGAVVVGARQFLIAYNIDLNTQDVSIAKAIARAIRASSGGLDCVKAIGLMLEERGQAQVSMNLTDFEVTPIDVVFRAVEREAARHGVSIARSEVIGLLPRRALEQAAAHFLHWDEYSPGRVLENRLSNGL